MTGVTDCVFTVTTVTQKQAPSRVVVELSVTVNVVRCAWRHSVTANFTVRTTVTQ